MTILGYGEDAFTLHALKYGLSGILRQLDDPTPSPDALVVFRPSFGRRSTAAGGPLRAEFGEPDALIGTPHGTYIVEAKWSSSSEWRSTNMALRDAQTRRHAILRCYVEAWRSARPSDWNAFIPVVNSKLTAVAPSAMAAHAATRLAETLEFVLRLLASSGPVADVLLFCRSAAQSRPELTCDGFQVVHSGCVVRERSNFVVLDGAPDITQEAVVARNP